MLAELADEIKGTGDENGVFGRGFRHRKFESLFGVRYHGKTRGMMAGDFGELRGRDRARSAGSRKDNLAGKRKKKAGDFIHGFVTQRAVEEPDLASGKVLSQEMGELASG